MVQISAFEGPHLVPNSLKIRSPLGPNFKKNRSPFHVGAGLTIITCGTSLFSHNRVIPKKSRPKWSITDHYWHFGPGVGEGRGHRPSGVFFSKIHPNLGTESSLNGLAWFRETPIKNDVTSIWPLPK